MPYSTIQTYTNAKGVSHQAHFNKTKYIGSVKKLGNVPILLKNNIVVAVPVETNDLIQQIIDLQLENNELRETNNKLYVIN